MSSRFSCVAPEMEFSLDLRQAVKNKECALKMGCGVYLDIECVEFVIAG